MNRRNLIIAGTVGGIATGLYAGGPLGMIMGGAVGALLTAFAADGASGTESDPLEVAASAVYGPKGKWAVRTVNGVRQLGQYSQAVSVLGKIVYKFVPKG